MIALFVALLLITGAGTLAVGRQQSDRFEATTSIAEAEMGTLAMLHRGILDASEPMTAVLYEFDRGAALDERWQEWRTDQRAVATLFAQLLQTVESHSGHDGHAARSDEVREAEAQWAAVSAGVDAAKAAWGTGEVADALVSGSDPFEDSVWAPYQSAQRHLAQLSVASVGDLRQASNHTSDQQEAIEAFAVAALAVVLMISIAAGRRMSKRVIGPLVSLRSTIGRLQRGDLDGPVSVPRAASSEIAALADAIAEMTSALGATQAHLQNQAYTDGLTGLANRRAFTQVLEEACRSGCDSRTSLLLIDIDDFKRVNDALGHTVGDEVLAIVGERLGAEARAGDTVARVGGDEFAIVVRGEDSLGTALAMADRLMDAFQQDVEIDGERIRISCSVGIGDGHGARSADDIVRHADAAMYVAKSRGKSCVESFDPMLHATMLSRSEIKEELHAAAQEDQLELHYQPVIDLDTDQVLGFEALVRWRHPSKGLLMPAAFIDTAEESGAIVAIGDWVVDRACTDLRRLQAVWTGADPVWIAVNISGRQVANSGFVQTVRTALDRHGIDPGSLILELTEAQLLSDPVQASLVLEELRADGVRIAIDDFGTGFSSLQYLTDLPIDILKIDRAFVQAGSVESNDGIVVLEAIASMGKALGLGLIAEGIEEHSELERLRRLGPMAGQGYLFAHPMTADDALVLFETRPLTYQ